MMLKRIALGFIAALALLSPAKADVAITAGSGTTIFDYICFSTKHCAAVVPTNSGGTEIMTSGNAAYVQFPSAQAVTVSQATSSNLKAQVDPLTAASWGIATATQNSASATLGQLVLGQFNTTPTTITSGNMSPLQLDSAGNVLVNVKAGGAGGGAVTVADGADATQGAKADAAYTSGSGSVVSILKGIYASVTNALAAGTNYIGQVGLNATTSGGWTPKWFVAANSDNATNLKNSGGIVHAVQVFGIGSAPAYLKFYDMASSPTCGSSTIVKQIMIPAASTAANGSGAVATVLDAQFNTGISYCVVTGIGATDDTSPAASTFVVNIDWK